jgi:predicted transcriptional regulator of viral defense system
MQIKNHLSKKELEIYTTLKENKNIFNTKEIQAIYPDKNKEQINIILKKLIDKNYLLRIQKGDYIVNKAYNFKELQKIAITYNFGYVAYSTALYNYGLIDYLPETIFIATKNKSKEITINQTTIKYINTKQFNNYKIIDQVPISILEKTIIDCLQKIEYSGGFSVISKAIYECAKKIDWNLFIEINKNIKSKRQKQITGYILEIIKKKTNAKIPYKTINYFQNQEKSKTYLLNNKIKTSKYISKWKIKDNYGEKNIISWWD